MWWWIALTLLVLLYVGWKLSTVAGRLDRLHKRVDQSRAALEAQTLARAAVVGELASSGLVDPATSMVCAEVARESRIRVLAVQESATRGDSESVARRDISAWEIAENEVAFALSEAFDTSESLEELTRLGEEGSQLSAELLQAVRRVELAQRFHNDAVAATLLQRQRRLARWFHLAGHTPLPQPVNFAAVDSPAFFN